MRAERSDDATLVDLLDRVLKKGLVLRADLIISVAGIPLIGVNLTAAIGGLSTMLEYGMWGEWDAAQRAFQSEKRRMEMHHSYIDPAEEVLLTGMASCLPSEATDGVWQSGSLICTDRRILIIRRVPETILMDLRWTDIRGWRVISIPAGGGDRDAISLDLKDSVVSLASGRFTPLCSLLRVQCGSPVPIAG